MIKGKIWLVVWSKAFFLFLWDEIEEKFNMIPDKLNASHVMST